MARRIGDEAGIPDVLAARERDGELGVPAWERYAKHVKAVVQVGESSSGPFDTVLGYPAEIVALVNPYTLTAGGNNATQYGANPAPTRLLVTARRFRGRLRFGVRRPEFCAVQRSLVQRLCGLVQQHFRHWLIRRARDGFTGRL